MSRSEIQNHSGGEPAERLEHRLRRASRVSYRPPRLHAGAYPGPDDNERANGWSAGRLMDVAEFGRKGGVPSLGPGIMARAAHAIAESKIAYPLNAWKYVGRLLNASDSIMFRTAEGAHLGLSTSRIARAEGLRGSELRARVKELQGMTPDQMAGFKDQAAKEGFTGSEFKARVNELRLPNHSRGCARVCQ